MDASTGSSPSPLPESPLKVLADTLIRLKETPTAENAVLCRAHKLPRTFNPHEVPSGLRNGNLDVVVTEFYNRKGFRKCSIPGCNDSHTNFKTIIEHQEQKHGRKITQVCLLCLAPFDKTSNFKRHFGSFHTPEAIQKRSKADKDKAGNQTKQKTGRRKCNGSKNHQIAVLRGGSEVDESDATAKKKSRGSESKLTDTRQSEKNGRLQFQEYIASRKMDGIPKKVLDGLDSQVDTDDDVKFGVFLLLEMRHGPWLAS